MEPIPYTADYSLDSHLMRVQCHFSQLFARTLDSIKYTPRIAKVGRVSSTRILRHHDSNGAAGTQQTGQYFSFHPGSFEKANQLSSKTTNPSPTQSASATASALFNPFDPQQACRSASSSSATQRASSSSLTAKKDLQVLAISLRYLTFRTYKKDWRQPRHNR